jgi:hypothetical protein
MNAQLVPQDAPPSHPAPLATPTQAMQVLTMLERVLTAPDFDIERAERLWAMQKEVRAEQAKASFIEHSAAMQAEIPAIKRTGKIKNNSGQVQSTYAKWEHINEAVKPVLQRHGFALAFKVNQEGNKIIVTGVLSHRDGHSETTTIELAPDTTGSKNAPQAIVSAISYGKRTAAGALLNITSYDEDDDGQTFGDRDKTDTNMAKVADFEQTILEATDEPSLLRIGQQIAGAGLPPRLQTRVRNTYKARLGQLREPAKAGAQ